MENNWVALECYILALIFLVKGFQCQDLIGPSPRQAVLVGQTYTLTCSKAPTVPNELSWLDNINGIRVLLYYGSQKLSRYAKYDNFKVVSGTAEQLDLEITNITVEDEGTYSCQIAGLATHQQVILTVEERSSSLNMTQGGSGTSLVTVREGEPSEIMCTAIGARPTVTIDWYHIKVGGSETKITDGVNQVDTPNPDKSNTTDSESILMYTATKDYNGGSLRCVTTGQEVAESRQDTVSLNVLYVPVIEVMYADNTVICKSDANPVATTHTIIVNGTLGYNPLCDGCTCTLPLEVDYDTAIRCNATNLVGTGIVTTLAVPALTSPAPATTITRMTTPLSASGDAIYTSAIVGGALALVLGISIIIIILLVYLLVRKKNSNANATRTQSSSNVQQVYMELDPQTLNYESTYQQPLANNSDTSQMYADLNPETQDNKTAYQELDINTEPTQGTETQAYEEIQESKAYVNV